MAEAEKAWEKAFREWLEFRGETNDNPRVAEAFRIAFLRGADYAHEFHAQKDAEGNDGLTEEERELMRAGKHISVIRSLRDRLSLSLSLAKAYYDRARKSAG